MSTHKYIISQIFTKRYTICKLFEKNYLIHFIKDDKPMTDKQGFLEKLKDALIQRNISEQDIAPYIEQFDRFYDRMVQDEDTVGAMLNDIDKIADNIAAQVSDRYDEINRFAERTMTVQTVSVDTEIIEATELEIVDESDAENSGEAEEVPADIGEEPVPDAETASEGTKLPDYVEKEVIPNSKKFLLLFGVTLPITLPLALLGMSLFVAVWIALMLGNVVAIVAMIATAAVGTVAALVGIIYGITQLFVSVPTGLYEIGIGVVIVGLVLFVCILLYNFAIRLMPFLIKRVFVLFKFTLSKLKARVNRIRKECAEV